MGFHVNLGEYTCLKMPYDSPFPGGCPSQTTIGSPKLGPVLGPVV